jgi:hypothetical protein
MLTLLPKFAPLSHALKQQTMRAARTILLLDALQLHGLPPSANDYQSVQKKRKEDPNIPHTYACQEISLIVAVSTHAPAWPPEDCCCGTSGIWTCAHAVPQSHPQTARLPTLKWLPVHIIITINPCKPYLTASALRLTHGGGGK